MNNNSQPSRPCLWTLLLAVKYISVDWFKVQDRVEVLDVKIITHFCSEVPTNQPVRTIVNEKTRLFAT